MPPHKTYIEPCMGSAEVFLRKKPVQKEILNDYNGDLVKFFRVLQNSKNLNYLLGRLYFSFNSEQIFKENRLLLNNVPNILDDITDTVHKIDTASRNNIELAVAFFENQTFSFCSTGKTFAIDKRDMTRKFGRLVAACARLRNAIILHRDYKDAILYAANTDTFILLDPPYKDTESYYQKSNFDSNQHKVLFDFMNNIHMKYKGECKFIITYNNDPYILSLAKKYGFNTYIQKRLHNMRQNINPGEIYEELLIANYDLKAQAKNNELWLNEQSRQISLFDFKYEY